MTREAPWYKRYPDDYQKGTRRLSLEVRGAYSDILDLLYMNDGFIPDDEKWIGHALCISTRKWRTIRAVLLDAKKIQILDGKISNIRARDEIEIRRSQADSNRETALKREKSKRDSRSAQARTNLEPALSQRRTNVVSASNQHRTDSEDSKKANENNKTGARNTHHAHACAAALETETETDSEVRPPVAPQSDADEIARKAYLDGERIKQGVTAKSARAVARAKGSLDGSAGIEFRGGRLTVANGAADSLRQDFPGIDLASVCDRAAPEIARMNYPSADDATAVLRKWARIVSESKPPGKAPPTNTDEMRRLNAIIGSRRP